MYNNAREADDKPKRLMKLGVDIQQVIGLQSMHMHVLLCLSERVAKYIPDEDKILISLLSLPLN